MKKPKVTIVSISYNQEAYIKQTLEGFLMQETDFHYEVIIADDHSTDGTAAIIKEIADKNPDIIKPILRKKNVGIFDNLFDALNQATGDYVAICEGDDYWTDALKLQLQVEFLDKNKDYALCFHPVRRFYEDKSKEDEVYPASGGVYTIEELLKKNFIQTNSVLYRRQDYTKIPKGIMPIDYYLHLYHAQFGKIGFIDKVMADYRKHDEGIWWDSAVVWKKYGESHLELYSAIFKLYGENDQYRSIILSNIYEGFLKIKKYGEENATEQFIKKHPNIARELITRELQVARERNAKLKHDVVERDARIKELTTQQKATHSSFAYQFAERLNAPKRLVKDMYHFVTKGYIPDSSSTVKDDRSERLNTLLGEFYEYHRKKSGIKVAILARGVGNNPTSSLFIRLIAPLTSGKNNKKINLSFFEANTVKLPKGTDVCIVQRTAFDSKVLASEFLNDAKSKNIRIVLDTDDAFTEIDTAHPEYDVQKSRVQAFELIEDAADSIWVSSEKLETRYIKKRQVYRNSVDDRIWSVVRGRMSSATPLAVVYMGTATHDEDLKLVLPAIEKINQERENSVHLTIIGIGTDIPERSWITINTPPADNSVYPRFSKWFAKQGPYDVGIAPLVDSGFNDSKSDIKALDYLLIGALPVVSESTPYAAAELDDFIVRAGHQKDSWYRVFKEIVTNRQKYIDFQSGAYGKLQKYIQKTRSTKEVSRAMYRELKQLRGTSKTE